MDVIELIDKISLIKKEIYNYIIDTEHWLFYWIENKEVQDFIKEYPEDYNDRVHLHIIGISSMPFFRIKFDDHPNNVEYIERFANLATFRDSVKARWLEWNGKVKELQIKEKEKELAYHKDKVDKIEKEILELKML
jgi:hypothetical protein